MNDPLARATADQLVDVHGKDAIKVAENAIDRFARRGDADGQRIWKDVLRAVHDLLGNTEPEGDRKSA